MSDGGDHTRVEERVGPSKGTGTKCQILKFALKSRYRQKWRQAPEPVSKIFPPSRLWRGRWGEPRGLWRAGPPPSCLGAALPPAPARPIPDLIRVFSCSQLAGRFQHVSRPWRQRRKTKACSFLAGTRWGVGAEQFRNIPESVPIKRCKIASFDA